MKPLIIDASVAIKWFIPEQDSASAIRLFDAKSPMLAPDLIRPEIGNVVWKLVCRQLLKTEQAYQILNDFLSMPIEIHDSQELIVSALEIAVETERTVYDSLYLALAAKTGGVMITADARLANAINNTHWKSFIRLME
jgi:predicted nucleic acid-binding protein